MIKHTYTHTSTVKRVQTDEKKIKLYVERHLFVQLCKIQTHTRVQDCTVIFVKANAVFMCNSAAVRRIQEEVRQERDTERKRERHSQRTHPLYSMANQTLASDVCSSLLVFLLSLMNDSIWESSCRLTHTHTHTESSDFFCFTHTFIKLHLNKLCILRLLQTIKIY